MFRAMFSPIVRSTWMYLQYLVVFTQVAACWCLQWVGTACIFNSSKTTENNKKPKNIQITKYKVFNLKVTRILIWVIYLLRFTRCYITQLTSIYSKCWKWCPFISMHLSTRFTMFLATFLSVISFFNYFHNNTFYWRLPSKFSKETLSTVGVRHRC